MDPNNPIFPGREYTGCSQATHGTRCPAWEQDPHLLTTSRRCLHLLPLEQRYGALVALRRRP